MNTNSTPSVARPDRLAVFTFLWACQALVHQEYYARWVTDGNPFGWLLTVVAVLALVFPRSLGALVAMLVASVVFNVLKWPHVSNHILMETMVNGAVLFAVLSAVVSKSATDTIQQLREQIVDRFAPVVMGMLLVMYYFAFIAKLNYDFFDPELSCVSAMYGDLVRRVPFIPTADWAKLCAIWSTVVIEAAIPVLLTFRRTKYLAILLGLPFHLMLGLIGHRTFSAVVYALYGLFLMIPLVEWVGRRWERATERLGPARFRLLINASRIAVVLFIGLMVVAKATGHYRDGFGPFLIFRFAWGIWILWSLAIAAVYVLAMYLHHHHRDEFSTPASRVQPGWLWVFIPLVITNGMSQYLGLKTGTSFTMYSNLQTEGGVNNHLFMPALRLANYQDNLVEIVDTDHPELGKLVEHDHLITRFEFRRLLSQTEDDLVVTYRYNNQEHVFQRKDGQSSSEELSEPLPLLARKLLLFRPVPKGDGCPCHH